MYEVEDITENVGTHGVGVYSVINNMQYYTVEVRASGYEVMEDVDEEVEAKILEAVKKFIIKQTKEQYNG